MVPNLRSPRNFTHPLQNRLVWTLDHITSKPLSDTTCPCLTSSSAYLRFVTLFLSKRQDKVLKAVAQGQESKTKTDSLYCIDHVVPEGTSQVSRRPEIGNHKWCTRLSSGTSAGTVAVSAGPFMYYRAKQVRKMIIPRWEQGNMQAGYRQRRERGHTSQALNQKLIYSRHQNPICIVTQNCDSRRRILICLATPREVFPHTIGVSESPWLFRNPLPLIVSWHDPCFFFCTSWQKGLENWSSRFEAKIILIYFLRGSGPAWRH